MEHCTKPSYQILMAKHVAEAASFTAMVRIQVCKKGIFTCDSSTAEEAVEYLRQVPPGRGEMHRLDEPWHGNVLLSCGPHKLEPKQQLREFNADFVPWFVSHAWLEPVCNFVACLKHHTSLRQLSDQTAYWVCAYANNQHQLENEICNNPRKTSFYRAIQLNPLLLDVAATENGRAHVITDGLVGAEQQMMPLLGFLAKSRREAEFPTEILLRLGYDAVSRALAGHFALANWFSSIAKGLDTSRLLTALRNDEKRHVVLRALAWALGMLDVAQALKRLVESLEAEVKLQRSMMPQLRVSAKRLLKFGSQRLDLAKLTQRMPVGSLQLWLSSLPELEECTLNDR
eukprot:s4639_g1.t1